MAYLQFESIQIAGISACVPRNVVKNSEINEFFTQEEIAKFIKTVGVEERRFVENSTTTSDLCFEAAKRLLEEKKIARDEIDLLVFVSQTPDYIFPATSIILQNRLNLSKKTLAFDVGLGCTGYVYGLSIVYSFLLQQNFQKALLLAGETPSKLTSMKDKGTALLFGDAGTATLVEKNPKAQASFFSLNSDGSGENIIKIKAGGFRYPASEETLKPKIYEDSSIRNDHQQGMDGMEVFNFTMREIPKDVIGLLQFSQIPLDNIDFVLFHQANKFIMDFIAKKIKCPLSKVLSSLSLYGNTSSASIPLTIALEREKALLAKKLLLSSFGVGLSWGNAVIPFNSPEILDIIEV